MKSNNHLTAIEEKTLETLVKSLKQLQMAISSHITPLSAKERLKMLKMGEKTFTFVKKCFEFSQKNPELCPRLFDMDAYEADYKDANNLRAAINLAAQLHKNLVDIQMCAGSEALQTSLVFYKSVKVGVANNVPGADVVYEELRKRFPNNRKRLDENSPQPDEQVI